MDAHYFLAYISFVDRMSVEIRTVRIDSLASLSPASFTTDLGAEIRCDFHVCPVSHVGV